MTHTVIKLNTRVKTGKMANKYLRDSGELPVVLYGKNGDNFMGSLPTVLARKLVADYSFLTRVFNIELDGKTYLGIPRDVQFNPISDVPDHFDFKIVDSKDTIVVNVPVVVSGKEHSVGLKRGGNVFITSYNVKLKTTVEHIPNEVEVNVADSVIGSKYYLADLKIPNAVPLYNCLVVKVSGRQTKDAVAETTAASSTPAVAGKQAPVAKKA